MATLREQYIDQRNKKEYTLNFLFSFYTENGGSIKDLNQFQQYLQLSGVTKENIERELDSHFKLTTLHSAREKGKNIGEFIKVVN